MEQADAMPQYSDLAPVIILIALAMSASALYIGIRLFMQLGRIRKESKRSFEVAERVGGEWQEFSGHETEARQRLADRVDRFEGATKDRVDRFEKIASGTRERLIKLEQYLKEFFEVELKTVFDSFDKTVSSILEQMKAELLRGLERIEDIQAFVDSKSFAQDRILDGEGSVYRLLAQTGSAPKDAGAAEEPEPIVRPAGEDDETSLLENPGDSRYRLEADEAD
jgi:hypothetical protein